MLGPRNAVESPAFLAPMQITPVAVLPRGVPYTRVANLSRIQ